MSDATLGPVCGETRAGGGSAALGAVGWLALAAAPTFALMALGSAFSSGPPDTLCVATRDASPLGGMAAMYGLMTAFHAGPWLRLIAGRAA
jgi:hypothetical protein